MASRRNTSLSIDIIYAALLLLIDSMASFLQSFLTRSNPRPYASSSYAIHSRLRAEAAAAASSTCILDVDTSESTSSDAYRSSTTNFAKTMTMVSSGCTLPPNNFHIFQCHVCSYRTSDRYIPLTWDVDTLTCTNCAHVLSTCWTCEAQSTSYVPYKVCWACGDLNGLGGLYAGLGVEGDCGQCQTCREELLDNSDIKWTWAKGREQGGIDVDDVEKEIGSWNRNVKRRKEKAVGGWGWGR